MSETNPQDPPKDDSGHQAKDGAQPDASSRGYRRLVALSPVPTVIHQAGKIIYGNAAAAGLLGFAHAGEMVGRSALDFFPPEHHKTIKEHIRQEQAQGDPVPLLIQRLVRHDGQVVDVSLATVPTIYEGRPAAHIVIHDLTAHRQAEESLRHAHEHLEATLNALPDLLFVFDKEGFIHEYRARDTTQLYIAPEEFIGKNVAELLPVSAAHTILKAIEEAVQSGYCESSIYSLPFPDGTRWFELTVSAKGDPASPEGRLVGLVRNVTERKQAEDALFQSELRYRMLVERVNEGVMQVDNDDVIQFVNDQFCQMLGYSRDELVGKIAHRLLLRKEDHIIIQEKNRLRRQMISDLYEIQMRRKSGEIFWVEISGAPIVDAEGGVIGSIGILSDITARKQAEKALKENESRYRSLFEDSAIGLWEEDLSQVKAYFDALRDSGIIDLRTYLRQHPEAVAHCAGLVKVLDVNKAVLELHGAKSKEELLAGLERVFTEESYPVFCEELAALAEGRLHFESEVVHRTLQGEDKHILMQLNVPPGYEDSLAKVFVSALDITERKSAREKLQELKEFNESIVQNITEGIAMDNVDGHLTFVNPAAAAMLGYTPEELVGQHWSMTVPPDQRHIVREANERRERGESDRYELEQLRKDGSRFTALVSGRPRFERGRYVGTLSVFSDISERLKVEAAEREQRALAEALRDTAAVLSGTLDLDEVLERILTNIGRVVPHDASNIMMIESGVGHVVRCQGYPDPELAQRVRAVQFIVDETSSLRQMVNAQQPLVIPDVLDYPGWTHVPGVEWQRSYLGAPICLEGKVIGFINLDSAEPGFFKPEHRPRLQAFANQAAVAIRNAQLFEETRRYAAELERRNDELDAYSYTVAHDLKAPLHIVIGYSNLLRTDFVSEMSEDVSRYLKHIENYAHKMNEIIEGLLLLARLREEQVTASRVEIGPVIEAALKRFEDPIRSQDIAVEVEPNLPSAFGHKPWLEEVFANLIENAIKYIGDENPEPSICIRGYLRDGMARYEVQDNGLGVAEEDLEHLFERFTRFHPGKSEGSGLGLSIVQRIVHRLEGKVGVESEPGKGSTFWFELPIARAM